MAGIVPIVLVALLVSGAPAAAVPLTLDPGTGSSSVSLRVWVGAPIGYLGPPDATPVALA